MYWGFDLATQKQLDRLPLSGRERSLRAVDGVGGTPRSVRLLAHPLLRLDEQCTHLVEQSPGRRVLLPEAVDPLQPFPDHVLLLHSFHASGGTAGECVIYVAKASKTPADAAIAISVASLPTWLLATPE